MLDAECIIFPGGSPRAASTISGIATIARCTPRPAYTGTKEVVFMWGPGGAQQQKIMQEHRKQGGTVIFFDLGYFHRYAGAKNCVRMSINDPHPSPKMMKLVSDDRWPSYGIQLSNIGSPDGDILLCGTGGKSRTQYGYIGPEWENRKVRAIQNEYPTKKIYYRPKPGNTETIAYTIDASEGGIEQQLAGKSLVVCHHSNVAVDCAIYGVECVSSAGIGMALGPLPTVEERLKFLSFVANFNWRVTESQGCYNFINDNFELIKKLGRKDETTSSLWQTRIGRVHQPGHGNASKGSSHARTLRR